MGLQKDVNISNDQFYDAVSLYPNLSIRFFKAHRQIGGCLIIVATLSCCMAAAKNAATGLALRILFGSASTFLQALTLYTSLWYKRNELAIRSGAFYSAATIAGGSSGLIAYANQKNLDGAWGHAAWQWLFIIQGCAGIFVGVCAWHLLPPSPDQIKDMKHWVFSKAELEVAIKRLKKYVCPRTQLFSIIPYACAFVTLLVINTASDRTNVKGPFLMLCFGVSITGYIVLMAVTSVKVKIFGTCLITMAEVVGQSFAILASHMYTDPPRYIEGHAISLSFRILGFLSALVMRIYMRYMNAKK
ncbi:major facilitator superfamily domain-containing protein [Trichoderma novae-zelandiae]